MLLFFFFFAKKKKKKNDFKFHKEAMQIFFSKENKNEKILLYQLYIDELQHIFGIWPVDFPIKC